MATVTTEHALHAIRATYPDLKGWQARARRMPPEEPQAGSQLAADDARFPWHRISEAAHLSLVLAGEHLRLAGWSLFPRVRSFEAERASGLSVGAAGGDIEHIAEPFVAAHLLLKEGWSLFDRLCEAP